MTKNDIALIVASRGDVSVFARNSVSNVVKKYVVVDFDTPIGKIVSSNIWTYGKPSGDGTNIGRISVDNLRQLVGRYPSKETKPVTFEFDVLTDTPFDVVQRFQELTETTLEGILGRNEYV